MLETMQDTTTFGVVVIRHCGYVATVRVRGDVKKVESSKLDVEVEDQPEGGANALNVNRYLVELVKQN